MEVGDVRLARGRERQGDPGLHGGYGRLGQYQLRERVGAGAMGEVYRTS